MNTSAFVARLSNKVTEAQLERIEAKFHPPSNHLELLRDESRWCEALMNVLPYVIERYGDDEKASTWELERMGLTSSDA